VLPNLLPTFFPLLPLYPLPSFLLLPSPLSVLHISSILHLPNLLLTLPLSSIRRLLLEFLRRGWESWGSKCIKAKAGGVEKGGKKKRNKVRKGKEQRKKKKEKNKKENKNTRLQKKIQTKFKVLDFKTAPEKWDSSPK
jgi:hypothetical protein